MLTTKIIVAGAEDLFRHLYCLAADAIPRVSTPTQKQIITNYVIEEMLLLFLNVVLNNCNYLYFHIDLNYIIRNIRIIDNQDKDIFTKL